METENRSPPASIQSAWDSLTAALLGSPAGPLADFEPYLRRDVPPVRFAPSARSGQDVAISDDYPPGTRFISNQEAQTQALAARPAALSLNDLQDIDSLKRALGEQLAYAGSISLGNCAQVERSNRVFDSQNVFESQEVFYSKHVGWCSIVKYSEWAFGSQSVGGHTKSVLKGFETYDSVRVLESVIAYRSSDLYYAANCDQCQDCLFSFNQRGRVRLIGNRPLSKEEFSKKKAELLAQMRDELKSKKALPSIVELIASGDLA